MPKEIFEGKLSLNSEQKTQYDWAKSRSKSEENSQKSIANVQKWQVVSERNLHDGEASSFPEGYESFQPFESLDRIGSVTSSRYADQSSTGHSWMDYVQGIKKYLPESARRLLCLQKQQEADKQVVERYRAILSGMQEVFELRCETIENFFNNLEKTEENFKKKNQFQAIIEDICSDMYIANESIDNINRISNVDRLLSDLDGKLKNIEHHETLWKGANTESFSNTSATSSLSYSSEYFSEQKELTSEISSQYDLVKGGADLGRDPLRGIMEIDQLNVGLLKAVCRILGKKIENFDKKVVSVYRDTNGIRGLECDNHQLKRFIGDLEIKDPLKTCESPFNSMKKNYLHEDTKQKLENLAGKYPRSLSINDCKEGIISEKWGSRAKERPWRIIAASKLLGRKSRRFEYSVAKRT